MVMLMMKMMTTISIIIMINIIINHIVDLHVETLSVRLWCAHGHAHGHRLALFGRRPLHFRPGQLRRSIRFSRFG